MTLTDTNTHGGPTALCVHSMDVMATGSRDDFDRVFHPQAVNREAAAEPPATRQPGPAGFYATAQWLRSAFSDLRFETHETAEHDDLVALHATMSGRHTGDFVTYQPDTAVAAAMPPTGKAFAVTQTHWFRTRDGLIIEHWANRDDLAMATQAGWIPPSPRFLLRAAVAKRRAQRSTGMSDQTV
jgi:predicted ester cyclase